MTPKERLERLGSIPVDEAHEHHEWLLYCFEEELQLRLDAVDYDEYENIYHCALLLHLISDLNDLPLLFSAKCSGNMDLGCGFDWQFLFMREPEILKDYAVSIERRDIADWIEDYSESYHEENMRMWLDGTTRYHRGS